MAESSCFPFLKEKKVFSENILKYAVLKKYQAKEIIIASQSKITSLYYIVKGTLRLSVNSVTGNSRTIFQAEPGNFIGEAHFFYAPLINANIEAHTDVVLAIFNKKNVLILLETEKDFRKRLITGLAEKALAYGSEMAENSYANDSMRLYNLLHELAIEKIVYTTQAELSMMCGVHRVTINRWCQELKNKQLIATYRNKILLL